MAGLVNWDNRFSTGNYVIDHQNRRLLQLINDLEEISTQPDLNPALIDIVFDEVTAYTNFHFKTEENIMEQVNYSDIDEHKNLHKFFIDQLKLYKTKVEEGTLTIDKVYCDFFKTWLVAHVFNEDQKIVSEMSTTQGLV
jgi:hemerythrin-like metal-binding protein